MYVIFVTGLYTSITEAPPLRRYSDATLRANGQVVTEFTEMPLPHVDPALDGGGGETEPGGGGGGGFDPAPRRLTLPTASRRRPVLNVVEAGSSPASWLLCCVIAV